MEHGRYEEAARQRYEEDGRRRAYPVLGQLDGSSHQYGHHEERVSRTHHLRHQDLKENRYLE